MYKIEMNLFSPRWGHEDRYKITINENEVEINMSQRIARYKYINGKFENTSKESLESIMRNDNIPIPENLDYFFFQLITSIIENEITEEDAQLELKELENWINCHTKSCQFPNTDYWKSKA
ncbi:hypothetical protein [Sulfurimonas hydrogeniphila]|uniref:hypothetical protein n=1 Tax=Sulfurimonas hydrogeniphila TaxID=2509341 RepID=UPI00125F17DD|nr:hypothetical protein [Sulfurimonas hydrogeniphila]